MSDSPSRHRAHFNSLFLEFADEAAFQSYDGGYFVTLPIGQTLKLDDPLVHDWLMKGFFARNGYMPCESAVRDTFKLLRAHASCGCRRPVALRAGVVPSDGSIIVDMANSHYEYAEITATRWHLARFNPGPVMHSSRGMLSLASANPDDPASLDPLRPLVNCAGPESDAAWAGITEWLVAALRPDLACPVLILHGPPGSGKTNAARMLRILADAHFTPLVTLPSRASGIERLAESNRVLAFDHVTRMSESAADALCRVTSAPDSHPVILTTPRMGVNDWQPRADLASRAITVHLSPIENPRSPRDLNNEFLELRPILQSALFTKVSESLAAQVLPRPAGATHNLSTASATADALYEAIATFISDREDWHGSATDLLNEITSTCTTATHIAALTPRALSHRLRTLTPALHAAGIQVNFHRTHGGIRQITISNENLRHPAIPEPLPSTALLPTAPPNEKFASPDKPADLAA